MKKLYSYIACLIALTFFLFCGAIVFGATRPLPKSASVQDIITRLNQVTERLDKLEAPAKPKPAPVKVPREVLTNKRCIWLGHRYIGMHGKFDLPEVLLAALKAAGPDVTHVVLDLETTGEWWIDLKQSSIEAAKAIHFINGFNPKLKVGPYNMPLGRYYNRNDAWRSQVNDCAEVIDASDFLTVATYQLYPYSVVGAAGIKEDHDYVVDNVLLALQAANGKPVYEITTDRRYGSNDASQMTLIGDDEYQQHWLPMNDPAAIVNNVTDKVDGIIQFEPNRYLITVYAQDRDPDVSKADAAKEHLKDVLRSEIPAGVSSDVWVTYLEARHTCLDNKLLGIACTMPAKPIAAAPPMTQPSNKRTDTQPATTKPDITLMEYKGPDTFDSVLTLDKKGFYPGVKISCTSKGLARGVHVTGDGVTLSGITTEGMADSIMVEPVNDLIINACKFLNSSTADASSSDNLLGQRGYGFYGFDIEGAAILHSTFSINSNGPQHSNQYPIRCGMRNAMLVDCDFIGGNDKRTAWFMYVDNFKISQCRFTGGSENAGVVFGVSAGEVSGVTHGQAEDVNIEDCDFNLTGGPASAIIFQAGTNGVLMKNLRINTSNKERWLGIDNRGDTGTKTVDGQIVTVDYHASNIHWSNIVWNGKTVTGYEGVTGADAEYMKAHRIGPLN